jgi:hypothetical protein
MTIVSGHQPVYLPWLGLFHKIALCDTFVFMDDVQYLRQDWNNRNRIKGPQGPFWLTVPVALKESASEILADIRIAQHDWGGKNNWQQAHWKSIQSCYRRAPFWDTYADELEEIYLGQRWDFLVQLNARQLDFFLAALDIPATVVKASGIGFEGQKSDLVLDHCRKLNGDTVVLGTHGRDYLDEPAFAAAGIAVYYQDYVHPEYPQQFGTFESHLSVLDLLFNCGPESREILLTGNDSKQDVEQAAAAARRER